ncbi:auxin efflux carrier [Geranomyces variabilis]|nr:auxin efflux carrier [Geranomyces variabilis]KAJ3132710.1 hypothetical protein HDU90_006762 [Geranomyces variabilis]
MSSFVNILVPTLQANAEILITTLSGAALGRIGILTPDLQKGLAKVSFWLLTPALIFSKIASTVDAQRFISLWPIPALFVFSSLISYALALLGCRFLRLSVQNERFITAAIVFTNTVTIPVPILTALTPFTPLLFQFNNQTPAEAVASGVSMALFFTLFSHVFRWSIGYRLLDAPAEKAMQGTSPASDVEANASAPSDSSHNTVSDAIQATNRMTERSHHDEDSELRPVARNDSFISLTSIRSGTSLGRPLPVLPDLPPPVARRNSDTGVHRRASVIEDTEGLPLIKRDGGGGDKTPPDDDSNVAPLSPGPPAYEKAPTPGSPFKHFIDKVCDFMNPPFASAILALIVGFHPSFQTFFFRSAGSSIGASLTQVGETSIPFQLIQLGGRLQRGPTRDATTTMPNRAIAFVVFCRLFLGPLIGLAFVGLLKAAHIAPSDPMLVFVLLMESSTPPALNLAVIAELHGKGEKDIANLLFWNYAVAVPGAVLTVLLYLFVIPSFVQ